MRMYELWRIRKASREVECLEDEGGPVLFPRVCDAEFYFQSESDRWEAECRIVPVLVGQA